MDFPLKRMNKKLCLCSHFIGQNIVTWTPAVRKSGKCSLDGPRTSVKVLVRILQQVETKDTRGPLAVHNAALFVGRMVYALVPPPRLGLDPTV